MSFDAIGIKQTQTGGRPASSGLIRGRYSLSVGMPSEAAPDGWKWSPLSELARLETGHTPSRKNPDYWDGDFCWIGIKDATSNHGKTLTDTFQHISRLGLENSSARLLPKNTVCLSRTASVGYVVVMGKEMATSQDFVNWVCGEDLDHHFLKYILLSERDSFLRFASGTTHQTIYFPEAKAFHVCIPSLSEQKAIAHILGTLDDKIELNRKTNETLEAMAKALFQSWFVDFDPVRAKAEGRPTGLPDEISDLFPDSFEESELGEIPRGWDVQTVADVASAIFDGPHATPAESDTGNIFLGIKNMTGSRISLDEIRLIHDDDWETWTRRVAPQSNDIVFTYEAALGLFAMIPPTLKCCLGRRMALIRPLPENGCPHFWFHQFIASPFQKAINERCIHGATVNRTPLTEFPDYPVLTPPLPLRGHFEDVASGLRAKIHALSDQSRTLAPLRDTLLPKLISGDLRIPEAEKLLEEAGV